MLDPKENLNFHLSAINKSNSVYTLLIPIRRELYVAI